MEVVVEHLVVELGEADVLFGGVGFLLQMADGSTSAHMARAFRHTRMHTIAEHIQLQRTHQVVGKDDVDDLLGGIRAPPEEREQQNERDAS